MPSCIVKKCTNSDKKVTKKKDGISFFRLPVEPKRREIWCRLLRKQRDDPYFKANNSHRICSAHFYDNDFTITKSGIRKLNTTATPHLSIPGNGKNFNADVEADTLMDVDEIAIQTASNCDYRTKASTSKTEQSYYDVTLEPNSQADLDVDISDLQSIFDTPRKTNLKRKINRLQIRNQLVCKKLKNLQKQNARLKKRNKSLSIIIKELRKKKYLSEEVAIAIEKNAEIAELYRLQFLQNKKRNRTKKRMSYPPALRKFAMTLNFYSPAAYKYVRRKFDCCLPHPRTLVKWYSSIDGDPGFTKEAFNVLKLKRATTPNNLECALIFDEMNIRQAKLWKGKRNIGCVDMGNGNIDENQKATKVFVLMLVCLSENWKIPLGYFLVNGLSSEVIASIISICLEKCDSVGVNVEALTFDGCPTNIKAVNILGCNIGKPGDLKTTFSHPVTKEDIVVFMDASHMIKLVRNVFENKKVIYNDRDQSIEWKFLSNLVKLQKTTSLNFANKITPRHIHFKNQIMKVKLATQLLSRSVANAIELCDKELKSSRFINSKATVEFISLFNDVFDVLNSREFNQYGFKRSMSEKNKTKIFELMTKAIDFIKKLKIISKVNRTIKYKNKPPRIVLLIKKKNILDTNSKTGFLGLIVCLESLKILYHKLIEIHCRLKYIATYRLSQDHLELFFSLLRKHGGYNDNPNVVQLKGAYRRALNHLSLKSSFTGNCIPLDNFPILTVSSSIKIINSNSSKVHGDEIGGELSEIDETENDITESNNCHHLSQTMDSTSTGNIFHYLTYDIQLIVKYIAGWIAKSLAKKLNCEMCIDSMLSSEKLSFHKLIQLKNMGGLCFPSMDLFEVCAETEKNIRIFKRPQFLQNIDYKRLSIMTLKSFIARNTFSVLEMHSYDQPATFNHRLHLIRAIIDKYIDVRMHHESNVENTEKITKRQKFKKLVLFDGQ